MKFEENKKGPLDSTQDKVNRADSNEKESADKRTQNTGSQPVNKDKITENPAAQAENQANPQDKKNKDETDFFLVPPDKSPEKKQPRKDTRSSLKAETFTKHTTATSESEADVPDHMIPDGPDDDTQIISKPDTSDSTFKAQNVSEATVAEPTEPQEQQMDESTGNDGVHNLPEQEPIAPEPQKKGGASEETLIVAETDGVFLEQPDADEIPEAEQVKNPADESDKPEESRTEPDEILKTDDDNDDEQEDNCSIDDNRYIPRSRIHQLGALAFIGLVLYLAFLPRWDFKDIVGMAPPEAVERGTIILSRKGYNPDAYSLKCIEMEKVVGFAQLAYMERFCDDGSAAARMADLGIPLNLYRLEFQRDNHRDIRLWINPTTGALFTMTFYPPPGLEQKRKEFYSQLLRYRRMAIPDSVAEKVGLSALDEIAGVVDSIGKKADSTKVALHEEVPVPEAAETSQVATEGEAIDISRMDLIRSGISVDAMNIAEINRGGLIYDWRIVRESEDICTGMRMVLTSYIFGGYAYTDKPDIYLPDSWLLRKDYWQYVRWAGLALMIVLSGFFVVREFVRKFLDGGLNQAYLKPLVILIVIVEFLGAVNEFPTHNNLETAFTRFFLRTFFIICGVMMSWVALDDRIKRFPDNRCDSLRLKRDGILIGLLGAVALMGLHNFLIWVGGKTGFVIGSSYLLGERIISGLPSYSGFLPIISSLRKGMEFLVFPFVFLFALSGIIFRKLGTGKLLLIIFLATMALLTFIEGSSPTVYIILLIGNIVLGVFAYTLMAYYFRDNIFSYVTAIVFYIFVTDGYHLIKGSVAYFFALNGFGLFLLALVPVIVALHISFFSPLREKFKEPIEEISPDDDWKLTT